MSFCQDELDESLRYLMREASISNIRMARVEAHGRPASAEPVNRPYGGSRQHQAGRQANNAKRFSAHVSGELGGNAGAAPRASRTSSSDFTGSSRMALNTSRDSASSDIAGRESSHLEAAAGEQPGGRHRSESRQASYLSREPGAGSSSSRQSRSASKGSKGSRTSATYYYGEAPGVDPAAGLNGYDGGVVNLDNETSSSSSLHNTSFEAALTEASAHQGEVVRIKVPYETDQPDSSAVDIERLPGTEISPRFNGHKVTIQVGGLFCTFISVNPLVPDAHYSERQDKPFSIQI